MAQLLMNQNFTVYIYRRKSSEVVKTKERKMSLKMLLES
jgi:hypothetical protein